MGFWAKRPFLPPWFAGGQRQGRLGRRRPADLPATAAASERGKRERAARGFSSLTHLGLGRAVEAAPRGGNGGGDGLAVVARCGRAARQWRGCGGSVVRRGRGRAIYSRSEVGSGEIFVLTGAPARSRRLAGIPAAGDGIARAERQDGSGGDGTTRAEVVEGKISLVGPAAVRRGGGPQRPAPGEATAHRRSGQRRGTSWSTRCCAGRAGVACWGIEGRGAGGVDGARRSARGCGGGHARPGCGRKKGGGEKKKKEGKREKRKGEKENEEKKIRIGKEKEKK
jgi:hypothetical protein